jgi:hypothetical protein
LPKIFSIKNLLQIRCYGEKSPKLLIMKGVLKILYFFLFRISTYLANYNYGLSPVEQHHQKKKLRKRNCLEEVLFFGDKMSHLAIFIFQKIKKKA